MGKKGKADLNQKREVIEKTKTAAVKNIELKISLLILLFHLS